ncbi:hypothetical protein [Rhodobacteraceae phage LS06-2018-MD07]|jgi:hypothetical protein|nr:hypothetical protein [Rhodobacteraceae phage LS06-2018-MD07]
MKKAEADKVQEMAFKVMVEESNVRASQFGSFCVAIQSMTDDTDPRLEVLGKVNQLLVEHGAFDNDDKLYYAFQDLCDIIESELRTKIKQEAGDV